MADVFTHLGVDPAGFDALRLEEHPADVAANAIQTRRLTRAVAAALMTAGAGQCDYDIRLTAVRFAVIVTVCVLLRRSGAPRWGQPGELPSNSWTGSSCRH